MQTLRVLLHVPTLEPLRGINGVSEPPSTRVLLKISISGEALEKVKVVLYVDFLLWSAEKLPT